MSVDATVRHVFGYDGGADHAPPLQLADEQTLVYVSGHTLHFTSTTTRAQHFLVRAQPRKVVAFDINWKTATFAIAAQEPKASIALYSYPDKKLRTKLELPASVADSDGFFEYSLVKFSRCGSRLVSIRPPSPEDETAGDDVRDDKPSSEDQGPLLCVWDLEAKAPVPGCESSRLRGSARFASFDPTNADLFVVGGDSGLQVWKMYTGKTAASSLLRAKSVEFLPASLPGLPDDADMLEWEEKREQFRCHAWLPKSRVLVANQAGELVLVDATEAVVEQYITTAARPDHCAIAGIVATVETLVLAYADGMIAWLQIDTWELLRTVALPGSGRPTSPVISVLAPTPSHAKAYVGTRSGKIFEVRASILLDEDEDLENEEEDNNTRNQTSSRGSSRAAAGSGGSDETSLVAPCANFPTGPACASAILTPFGGVFAVDTLVATGGVSGQLALWCLRECRLVVEVDVASFFAQDPSSMAATPSSHSNSRPGTANAAAVTPAEPTASTPPSVVITALVARPGDPIIVVGDHLGRLRALCASKTVGGGGRMELLAQHSTQLLNSNMPLDLLALHPTQAMILAASTQSGSVFLLSLDHEKRFPVLAFFTLSESDEHIVDVQWNASGGSASSGSLTLMCFSSRGLFYSVQYQEPPPENLLAKGMAAERGRSASPRTAIQLDPKVVAQGQAVLPQCAHIRFLASPPTSMLLSASPGRPELGLLKFRDVAHDSTAGSSILSKVLAKNAHTGGISALALFPHVLEGSVELLATAGMDGTVTLWTLTSTPPSANTAEQGGESRGWQLEDMQAAKKRTLVTHSGPVTTLRFVGPRKVGEGVDIQLVSTGVDGCVFLMDVRLSTELLGAAAGPDGFPGAEMTMNPLYMNVVSTAKYDDVFQPEREQERTPFLETRARAEAAAARDRFDRHKDATRTKLRDLEGRLKLLLAENERLPESEQLARDEFVLNVAWRDDLLAQHAARAQRVRDGIARDLARMAIVRERMKREFWDSAEVPGVRITALSPSSTAPATTAAMGAAAGTQQSAAAPTPAAAAAASLFVHNFPMRRQSPQEQKLAQQVGLLRLVEWVHHQQEDRDAQSSASRARFQETVPSDVTWIVDAGTLHPSAQEKQANEAGSPASEAERAASTLESADYNTLPSFHLMYHPAAVRTLKQARVQMQLLRGYMRALLAGFNAEFRELVRQKEAVMEQIESKNTRILEISAELNPGADAASSTELFRPQWAPEERAESILEVRPEEMTQKPYETTERRRQREREAREAAEREKARKKDDVGGRALIDMMDGTLEVKKDPLAAQELVKEPWMLTTAPEDMTAEQKKLVAQFEAAQAKFEEEREKYRKSLDLELKKTRGEVIELCRGFDDKLRGLRDRYLATRRAALTQELYELRLAEELLAREQLELEVQRLEKEIRAHQELESAAQQESDRFTAQYEVCREDWQRATDEDKALEKNFVRELEDLVLSSAGSASTASAAQLESPELVKQLLELYRKRKPDDLALSRDGTGGSLGDGSKRAVAGAVGASSRGVNGKSAKQRLLAESASMTSGMSSSALGGASLRPGLKGSSSGAALEPEVSLDPFQHLDNQQAKRNGGGTGTGAAQRLVVVPLDYESDRPEGVLIEDRIWRALNALRAKKILAEHAVREKAEQLGLAKAVSDELRSKLKEMQRQRRKQQRQRETLAKKRTALEENAPLLVHLKQGQDETPVEVDCGEDALLVARTSVEALNGVIQLHGKDQVGVLGRIKDFRKSINVMEWEHALLELTARDMDERYTDIQLLRVTKDLQELFHTGDTSQKQKRETVMLEAKLAHLGRHHQTSLQKLDKASTQLERQLRERERENQAFEQQVAQLETQVQIREDILTSRNSAARRQAQGSGQGDAAPRGDAARLKAISVRRKLVDLAKAQTDEIEFLRLELDKMRRRTFPSFAHAHAREYHDVD